MSEALFQLNMIYKREGWFCPLSHNLLFAYYPRVREFCTNASHSNKQPGTEHSLCCLPLYNNELWEKGH